jgi:UDP-N-acetylglucosamine 3-dehydrogenase
MGRVVERKLEPSQEEPLKLELKSFVEAVGSRRPPVVTGEDGLKALKLAISINNEIESRSKVVWR